MFTILIIDDNLNLLRLYKQELRKEGYDVISACSGEESLRIVEEKTPDLVILEMRLPGIDGTELIGQLLSRCPKAPIIINTASRAYQDHFMSWCAEAYIIKSSDLSELKSAVNNSINKCKAA
jgi:DNA-binding response OmpR family regulator